LKTWREEDTEKPFNRKTGHNNIQKEDSLKLQNHRRIEFMLRRDQHFPS
jgi:hypothetical protein